MYPRNAATPPTITIGQVVQISDGAVQTTGASVRVKTGSGAWGAGSGTLACDTTSGVWTYAPTQGETDAESCLIAVYKASCIGCDKTVVTSASATAGKAVLSGETHTGAVIPTVSAISNLTIQSSTILATGTHNPQTGDGYAILANVSHGLAALKTLIDAIGAKTNNLPSDPADASDIAAAFSTVNSTLSTIAGYIDTEVAAIKAKTDNLPAAPASTADCITASGVRAAVGLAAANLDTQLGDIPTNSELSAALAAADDAVLAAIAALNNLSASDVNAQCDTALSDAGVTTARMGALTDWIDGGRLDLLLDAILADTGTDGVALSAAVCNKIADHVLRRNQSNVEASSNGDALELSSVYGAVQQMQEASASGTTLTVKKTDGSTTLGTKTLATDAAADPVTGVS